jgi:hypothetical protein
MKQLTKIEMFTFSSIKSAYDISKPYGPFYMQAIRKSWKKSKTLNFVTVNPKSSKRILTKCRFQKLVWIWWIFKL